MAELVLITGAAKRIGRELTLHYAKAGWRIALHHYRSLEEAIELQATVKSHGGHLSLFQADFREKTGAEELLTRVFKECGVPKLLINNASVFEKDETPVTEENFAAHMTVNLFAPIRLTQGLYAKSPEPCVSIALCDATLQEAWKNNVSSYALSKVALESWVKESAASFLPKLRLHGLMLGPTLPHERESKAHFQQTAAATPSHEPTSLEKIAATIDQLVEKPCEKVLLDLS